MRYTLYREGTEYKGNLHLHTTVSDGEATPQEAKEKIESQIKELGITEVTDEKLMAVATAACAPSDTLHNMPFEVTPEKVCAALKAADAYGRYYLGE